MKTAQPLVSIVIPVYNGANYMREAIDSALVQTYPKIEVIVVNDGSTDETEQIALSYGDKIRYISQQNRGQSAALNRGLQEMKGDYFSWLSHDDLYHKNKIEAQIDCILAGNFGDSAIVYSDLEIIDQYGQIISQVHYSNLTQENLLYMLFMGNIINFCTLLVPKSILYEQGFFNIARPHTSDVEMLLRLSLHTRMIRIAEVLVKSRAHPMQATKQNNKYHVYESNMLGMDSLDSVPRVDLMRSAAAMGVKSPYVRIAFRMHERGMRKAGLRALFYAKKYEISGFSASQLQIKCYIVYCYRAIRRVIASFFML